MAAAKQKSTKFMPTVEEWQVRRVKPFERNAMIHSEAQVTELMDSMKRFGWTMPLLVEPDGTIIAGHGRFEAATRLGHKVVPAIVARGWSDLMKRQYRIADNQLARKSKWDPDKLFAELNEIAELGGLEATGITLREFDGLKPLELRQKTGAEDGYQAEFQVIVKCPGEKSQADLLTRLTDEGFECRALSR